MPTFVPWVLPAFRCRRWFSDGAKARTATPSFAFENRFSKRWPARQYFPMGVLSLVFGGTSRSLAARSRTHPAPCACAAARCSLSTARASQRGSRFPRVRSGALCGARRRFIVSVMSRDRTMGSKQTKRPAVPCLMAARRRRFYRPSCLGAFCGELYSEATAPAPRRVVRRAPTEAVLPAPTAFVNADRGANRAECAAAAAAPSIPPRASTMTVVARAEEDEVLNARRLFDLSEANHDRPR